MPYSSPAASSASWTAGSSSHGANSSQPGCPTMPCRSARTCFPAISTVVMLKKRSSGGVPPSAFSITAIAFGPCTWNR
jgi:hypothetical protein